MRRVLIHNHHARRGLGNDVILMHLPTGGPQWVIRLFNLRLDNPARHRRFHQRRAGGTVPSSRLFGQTRRSLWRRLKRITRLTRA